MEASTNPVLLKATFNPKVKTYIFLVVLFYLLISVAGWVIVPFWLFGLGQWLSNKFFHTLACELSYKQLRFSKGLIIHIEKTIPLENIQDLSFIGGPILRWFGLTLIRVETAGGGGQHGGNMMSMIGIENAEDFKVAILNQREKIIRKKNQHNGVMPSVAAGASMNDQLLKEIKSELIEIKNSLKNK
jgi:putative membrane protein